MTARPSSHPSRPRELALALLVFSAVSIPFLPRPIHLDDPLFLWTARQIQVHPLDFYGASVNWFGTLAPLTEVMQNPPLVSYWLAAWTALFGWSEVSLHLALLPAALGALAGIWALARELGAPPIESLVAAAATPAFFVSSTTLMSDVALLCAWTWAVVLWVRGIRSGRRRSLAAGAALAGVALLTKYVGAGVTPLLLAYGLAARRRLGPWALWLLLPLAALAGYELATRSLYGRGLFLEAARYSSDVEAGASRADLGRLVSGLAFTGGAFLVVLWYGPRLWTARVLLGCCAAGALVVAAVAWGGAVHAEPLGAGTGSRWLFLAQFGVLAAGGAGILWLVAEETWRDRTPEGLLLALWVAGVAAFAFVLNWSLNVRSLLPMLPAVMVLASRRAVRRATPQVAGPVLRRCWPLAASAMVAVLVAAADHALAETARDAALRIGSHLRAAGRTAVFQGHWGFQWYAERQGLAALDLDRDLEVGDLMVLPRTNTNLYEVPRGAAALRAVVDEEPLRFLATMSVPLGAGFYADGFGPVPFAFGRVPFERYEIVEMLRARRAQPGSHPTGTPPR